MSTSRVQAPPVNLKERIAALQQRNVSPNQHQSSQTASRSIPMNGTGALRDRIAKFEEKGGVPVPRGSFGMGTPQLAENAPAKKRGELYGNRVQGLGRPSGQPLSRSGSPLPPSGETPSPRKRCVSTGGTLSGSPPSFKTDESVPPVPNNLPSSNPRRNSLAAGLSIGRRAVSTGSAAFSARDVDDTLLPSNSHPPPLPEEPASSPPLPSSTPKPSASSEGHQPQTVTDDITTVAPPTTELVHVEPALDVSTPEVASPDAVSHQSPLPSSTPESSSPSPGGHQPQTVTDDVTTVAPPTTEVLEPVQVEPTLDVSTPEVASPDAASHQSPDDHQPCNEPLEPPQVSETKAVVEESSVVSTDVVQLAVSPLSPELPPTSPASPSESTDPAPIDTPSVSSPSLQIEVVGANTDVLQLADACSAPERPELYSASPSPPVDHLTLKTTTVLSSTETVTSTADADIVQLADSALSPELHSPSPVSPPGPVGPVPLDSLVLPPSSQTEPSTSTNNLTSATEKIVVPVIVSTSEDCDAIPGNAPSSEMRVQVKSQAKSPSDRRVQSNQKPSFKAVVHRKVTEPLVTPAPTSSLAAPTTPQITRLRATNGVTVENPTSPGYGDLAVLLEEAAMLEKRLTEGETINASAETLLPTTPTTATFQPEGPSESASTLTNHASGDSSSVSGRSVSIPSIREPGIDSDIPEEDEIDGKSLASTTFSQRSPSHRKYLSSIRRFTSRRSSGHMPGAYPRDSISLSSEDSAPVATPPNGSDGKGSGFGIAWPSVSPKKTGSSVGRSSSFTDRIFNRSRTRSNVSTAETDRSSLYMSSQTNLSLTPTSNLTPEKRSDRADVGARPVSWMSPRDGSDFSPTPSLFDKDIFDAFPSVPQTLPPGPQLDARSAGIGRASTLPVKGRKHADQRLSMM